MPEPHPLFTYGPILFVVASFVASAVLSPSAMRFVKRRWGPPAQPLKVRLVCQLATIAAFWLAGTAVGFALLVFPVTEPNDGLPGQRIGTAVIAHMVPTVAPFASHRIADQLENGSTSTRWSPPGVREARLVLAARIDADTDRGVERLAKHGFRTHAGRFALTNPTGPACEVGLDAFAEALQGSALKDLMTACRNAPGDPIGYAAFKMGDFMGAVGPETESIISRQLRTPDGEPTCFAEGPDMPDAPLKMCRLEWAEMHKKQRPAALDGLDLEPAFARRWLAALRAEMGEPFDAKSFFRIDPALLVERPFVAIVDEPIAVYEDVRKNASGSLTPGQSAYIRVAIGAERSAAGRHEDAEKLVEEALAQLAIGDGGSAAERAAVERLAAAIALRARDMKRFEKHAASLAADDPLREVATVVFGSAPEAASGDERTWVAALPMNDGAAIAAALEESGAATSGGLLRLAAVPEDARDPLREWLRETFPACARCGFFATLDRMTVRLDAAHALGDEGTVRALEPIVARFEAVFLNRPLALSLRAADPNPF
ncbi:MAG: hypothetical protein HOW73_39845 [Polyangiaceae bacterium]|nr:hypothetical protein [Polyangiaceae bacterium]